MSQKPTQRFVFIDQFRGLVGIMMALGHSSYYFNSVWKNLDPLDPYFNDFGQFALRYMGYLCAPGFLMMNGAMTWYSYQRRRRAGATDWQAKWHLIQRGLFLVLVQITWVNSSWGGFREFKPGHFGIISCIGVAMCLMALLAHTSWRVRLGVGLASFAVHPLLLRIPYDPQTWQIVPMQMFIDAGDFNKYPVIPWFGMGILGSVMATGWLEHWKTTRKRVTMSVVLGLVSLALASLVRLARGYGNILPFSDVFQYSFFLDQKYPPSLYHNIWFFGSVVLAMSVIILLGHYLPHFPRPLGVVGRVPLFFYCVHIGLLGIFVKRMDFFYREGGVGTSFVGLVALLLVMMPLSIWFGGVKRRSRNYIIQMI